MTAPEATPSVPAPKRARPVLGWLANYIGDSVRGPAWQSFVTAAAGSDADCLSFVDFALGPTPGRPITVFDLIRPGVVDGLIAHVRMFEGVSSAGEREFLERFAAFPLIGAGRRLAGLPWVAPDYAPALEEALRHLIEVHGRRRIALFAASPEWDAADGCSAAYREALAAHGLPVDEGLIVFNAQERAGAASAVRQLFDGSGPRPDAVLTASDRAAYEVLAELGARGLNVPRDVAVIGCDDLPTSRFTDPALTSVAVPEEALATQAVRALVQWLRGGPRPAEKLRETHFMVRESCGCRGLLSPVGSVPPVASGPAVTSLKDFRSRLLHRLGSRLNQFSPAGSVPPGTVASLVEAYCAALKARDADLFLHRFLDFLHGKDDPRRSPWIWVRALIEIEDEALVLPPEYEGRQEAALFAQRALSLAHDFAWRTERLHETRTRQNFRWGPHVGLDLLRAQDLKTIPHAAARIAAHLGIRRYCACLHTPRTGGAFETRAHLAGRDGQPVELGPDGLLLDPLAIPPRFLFPEGEPFSVLVMPLEFQDLAGCLMMEQSSPEWNAYHEFAGHLGAALSGVRRLHMLQEQAVQLTEINRKLQDEVRERQRGEERQKELVAALRSVLSVADELVALTDRDQFYRRAVELAREKIGLERCGLHVLSPDGKKLCGTFGTDMQGRITDERGVVHDRGPLAKALEADLEAGRVRWVSVEGQERTHIAHGQQIQDGRGWIAAVPVHGPGQLLGILFNDTAISGAPLDEAKQEAAIVYGSLLGNLLQRRAAEERERTLAKGLRAVLSAANELMALTDRDQFFRRAVELAREKLGLERCGLHLLDAAGERLWGTFGTDTRGRNVDERGMNYEKGQVEREFEDDLAAGRVRWLVVQEAEQTQRVKSEWVKVGQGWIAATPVQASGKLIGVLYNDAAISGTPLDEAKQEAVIVYGSLLGNLLRRRTAEERQESMVKGLRAVLAAGDELVALSDRRQVCRRAVELAREKLGLERCAIHFLQAGGQTVTGTFGTDFQGRTVDETGATYEKGAIFQELERQVREGRPRWHVQEENYIYWENGQSVQSERRGWVAGLPIHSAGRVLGALFNDAALTGAPFDEAKQEVVSVFCSLLGNILQRRHLEEQLLQAQKMESIGRLAGSVAHDFNNLLTAILGFTEMAAAKLPSGSPATEPLEQVRHAGERAAALTQQLRAFSRKQAAEPKLTNLNGLLLRLDGILRRLIGEDVKVRFLPAPNLGLVRADPNQLEQVLLNLVLNARDAMPKGGRLTIQTANVKADGEYVSRYPRLAQGAHVRLTVSDTGIGMTPEVQARLFEPFFTTKERGTGLGLATCQEIIQHSGGHIAAHSTPGRGASFVIHLPRVEGAVTEVPAGARAQALAVGTETILVVEDEPQVRFIAAENLRNLGYQVLEAGDGQEALLVARNHPARLDLLLTDVIMPNLGGCELARKLRTERPGLRVLYVSGYTDDHLPGTEMAAEGAGFLQKPFNCESLGQKVRELLEGRRPGG
jgi:signal transduction histidine kinase/DNA-binding LacI/PurR family transcriptional regulator/CheY-like chemotaxis protein/PAS domain-containing protein